MNRPETLVKHWTGQAACRDLPSDWWDLGDDGNRLALAICHHCPVRRDCADLDHMPSEVIRAGAAWGVSIKLGRPLRLCDCGYPAGPNASTCRRCNPANWPQVYRAGVDRIRGRSRVVVLPAAREQVAA